MKSNYKIFIFDWDGTLYNSPSVIVNTFQQAFLDLSIPSPDRKTLFMTIGLSIHEAMETIKPELSQETRIKLMERFREHYLKIVKDIPLYQGVRTGLEKLKGQNRILSVATGKNRVGLDRCLDLTETRDLFQFTRCSDESEPKPSPRMLEDTLAHFNLKPEQALLIGDTNHDLRMAENAGVPAIAVSYGAQEVEDLEKHPYEKIFHDPGELLHYLSEL